MAIITNILLHKPDWYSLTDIVRGSVNPSSEDTTVNSEGLILSYPSGASNRPIGQLWGHIKTLCNVITKEHDVDGKHSLIADNFKKDSTETINDNTVPVYKTGLQQFTWVNKADISFYSFVPTEILFDYTIPDGKSGLYIINSSNNVTITLPRSGSSNNGYRFEFKNVGTGSATISAASGSVDTIDGFSTLVLSQWESCTLYDKGNDSFIKI